MHKFELNAGAEAGVDLTGGYYDTGDNIKFNFLQASAITLLKTVKIVDLNKMGRREDNYNFYENEKK